jgi:cytidylate kinase
MPIITISRDLYSHGEEIARRVAGELGYECIGPEIIQRVCNSLEFPHSKLHKALHDSPTFLEHISAKKEQRLAMFRAVFSEYMCHDNVVYHGLAGHVFLSDVPNVVKVRVIADLEERIREEMRRDGLTHKQAKERLIRDDKERAKWTKYLYGKDNRDPALYDLYLNLHNISIDAAVAIIVGAAQVSTNGNMELMRKKLKDMALAAKIEARLLEAFPEVEAVARDGEVFVSVQGSIVQEEKITKKAKRMASAIEGIKNIKIGVAPSVFVPF